ncbi:putative ribonuclease H-like domain-containing protein [Tanacetum coccineum]
MLGYNVVSTSPPITGNFMPPKPDLSFSGLEEFLNEPLVSEPTVKKHVVETSKAKASAEKPKVVRKNFGPPLIEDWISDSEDEVESMPKIEKKNVKPSFAKIKFVKSKEQVKSPRKTTVKQGGDPSKEGECNDQEKEDNVNSTNNVNAASTNEVNVVDAKTSIKLPLDPNMPELEDYSIFEDDEDVGAEANITISIQQSIHPIPTTRIQKIILLDQVIRDKKSAPQTRGELKAIRLFLAYASFKDCVVYQMDVKNAFLYGKIQEEVYVYQPPGFEDPDFPRVYKVKKALYGLHQAPRAWYETLSTYLLDNEFQRGKIDKTLFIKRYKGDILLVQVYVDDIIFGSTKELCIEFEKLMHKKFQMSSMGDFTFFLRLQMQQKKDGIFISQDKYVGKILKKFGFIEVKTASTPIETQKPLLKDENGEEVDVHMYRSMIGSLMYLTFSRHDIMFVVLCACARYQVNPKVSHLHDVKRIFRYLKGQPTLGLWYLKDSPFDLVAYTDSDYAKASLDRKSTTGGCQFLRCRLISLQSKKQIVVANSIIEAEYVLLQVVVDKCFGFRINYLIMDLLTKAFDAKIVNEEVQLQALVDGKKVIITESTVRRDLYLEDAEGVDCQGRSRRSLRSEYKPRLKRRKKQKPRKPKRKDTKVPQPNGPTDNVVDEAVYKEMYDSLERAAITATSLDA